ncbi:MAG: histidine--tRNA ligase [Clostridiales bacterium]|nr:histidine--tRNA ligase [Clostridiales bacterium]
MAIKRPRGVNDFLPPDTGKWRAVEALFHQMCAEYGFNEIRTPLFEETDLFKRGVGENTDIVQKEMYTFADQKGRSLTLRPEFTAALCRAYLENKMYGLPQPQKLYCMGPLFRYEKPQAGRFRQFHQFDIEVIGTTSPLADAESIVFAWDFYSRLNIKGLMVRLNSVGCPACRSVYRTALQDHLRSGLPELCPSCQGRFERAPMRILDCKSEICRSVSVGAPAITDYLCEECAGHYETVKETLKACGVPYTADSTLVRGLDYYTKTVFEICATGIGAQNAVCGGGRYDGLVEIIGGAPTPAMGVALGLERVFAVLAAQDEDIDLEQGIDAFVATDFEDTVAVKAAFALASSLRQSGVLTAMDYEAKSMKSQFKTANRLQAAYTVILGSQETVSGKAQVKNMESGEQVEMDIEKVRLYLLER